jgi:hypothetical protein
LVETLLRGKGAMLPLGEGGATVRDIISHRAGTCCLGLTYPFSRIYSTVGQYIESQLY